MVGEGMGSGGGGGGGATHLKRKGRIREDKKRSITTVRRKGELERSKGLRLQDSKKSVVQMSSRQKHNEAKYCPNSF